MTASTARSAYTTTIARLGDTIAEVTKIGGISMKAAMIDVTHLNSDYGFHEFVQGFSDGGSLPLEGSFIPGDTNGIIGLQTDHLARTLQTFTITFPAAMATTWTITAFVEEFGTSDLTVDGKVSFSASLKISGKPALAITASNNITALAVTTGTLVPTFAAATYSYVAHVATDQTTVTMTATFAAGTATLTYGTSSQTLTTTVPSSAITLGLAGTITTVTIVVQETSKIAKTYTIWVERAAA